MYCSGILLLSLYNGKSVIRLRTVQNGIPVMDYKTKHVVQFMPDFENFGFGCLDSGLLRFQSSDFLLLLCTL